MMSAKRTSLLPDVPTMAEASGNNLEADIVTGFVVPAGTPRDIVDRLYGAVTAVMAQPAFKARLATLGFDAVASTPDGFAEWINVEIAKWAKVIRDAHITLQ
jgi:tripartite-type tricarboxylate transporter receptor subunit TctC